MFTSLKLCVLTFMVFLSILTGFIFIILAWPQGEWGLLNSLMALNAALMLAASWHLAGCLVLMKKKS